jgi:hypothetical protein
MKRRNSNFSFAFKITLLGLLLVLGRVWQRDSSQYFYNKIDAIQVKSDTNTAPSDNKYALLRNVSWQVQLKDK